MHHSHFSSGRQQQQHGTPINRLPIMAKSVLDLYELYNLVIARGGLVDVINKKLWQEIIKGLHLPSSITSAAFTLRTQYMKYLYPYECEKKNLSTPAELQAAIDGNRREGRRSSYGQFDSPSVQRSPIPQGISQMPPLSLVSHVNQQQHHHRLLPPVGQIPNMLPAEFEQRMLNYIKMFQPKEMGRSQSPDKLSALNAIDISRVALWNMYNPSPNSPPNSLNTSPENNMQSALDLSESPDHAMAAIKRERDHPVDFSDPRDYGNGLGPPAKRSHHHHHSHHHNRSLTPQKLNSSSQDEDDARSDSTPVNLRENGSHGRRATLDDDGDDEEDEMEDETTDEDMLRASSPMGITGMQFKLISRGDASKGDQKLVVTMEFNGVQYEGVLFANPLSSPNLSAPPGSTPPSSSVSATSASPIGSMVSPVKSSAAAHIASPLDERDSAGSANIDVAAIGSALAATATATSNASSNATSIQQQPLDGAVTPPAALSITAPTVGAASPARSLVP
uniref:ARID domain-containing protein n=1 Tax=Anopheles melas TaxID=34690 RepID=A0A182U1C7_9DIPT